jgi:hypothetical protein
VLVAVTLPLPRFFLNATTTSTYGAFSTGTATSPHGCLKTDSGLSLVSLERFQAAPLGPLCPSIFCAALVRASATRQGVRGYRTFRAKSGGSRRPY